MSTAHDEQLKYDNQFQWVDTGRILISSNQQTTRAYAIWISYCLKYQNLHVTILLLTHVISAQFVNIMNDTGLYKMMARLYESAWHIFLFSKIRNLSMVAAPYMTFDYKISQCMPGIFQVVREKMCTGVIYSDYATSFMFSLVLLLTRYPFHIGATPLYCPTCINITFHNTTIFIRNVKANIFFTSLIEISAVLDACPLV